VLRDLFHLPEPEIARMMAEAIDDKTDEVAAGAPIVEVPGATAFVAATRAAGIRTALVSSASAANVRLALAALGLEDAFEVAVDAGQVTTGKPAPEPYLLAARMLGIPAAEMIVFEDSVAGIAAAQAAGALCVAIASWEPTQRLASADLVIRTWADWSPADIVATLAD